MSNIDENKQFRDAVQEAEKQLGEKLTRKDKERLHREASRFGLDYHEIVQLAEDMFK